MTDKEPLLDEPCAAALSRVWEADEISRRHDRLHKKALTELAALMKSDVLETRMDAIDAFTKLHRVRKTYEVSLVEAAVKVRLAELKAVTPDTRPKDWLAEAVKDTSLTSTEDPPKPASVPSTES